MVTIVTCLDHVYRE